MAFIQNPFRRDTKVSKAEFAMLEEASACERG
jgi:hypothetical protein